MFRNKFWVSLALTVPILIWGHMLPRFFGYVPPHLPGAAWIVPAFGTAVFLYGGWPFVHGAVREIRSRLPGMMTLIALAITVAFVFSAAVTLGFPGTPLWEELATLVTIMLLGHWVEMRSITQAAIRKLEWPGDQVRVLGVGRTRPDGRFCLANEGGKLLDEQNPWQIGRRGHGRQRRSDADGGESLCYSLRDRLGCAF